MPAAIRAIQGAMRRIDVAERRARLGLRHQLAIPSSNVVDATNSVVALHSSDPTTVYLSLKARVPGLVVADLESALYHQKSLIRVFGMRRTLWVADRAKLPIIHHSSTARLGEMERRRTIKILEDGKVTDDGAAFLSEMTPKVLAALDSHGERLTRDLTADIPSLRQGIEFYNRAGRLMGTTGAGSRVINQLALESRIVRTRPAGTWISGQYAWSTMEGWLGAPMPQMSVDEASALLVADYLRAFGPATEIDVKWWTGWPLRQLRPALAANGAVEVQVEGGIAYVLPDDLEPVDASESWVAALPSLDPTTMGWKERDWYMGEHTPVLFDGNGNAGATIWVDGRAVGGWAQRRDGTINHELMEDVGAEAVARVEDQLARLEKWFDGTVITPRFRSPSDKRLAG